MLGYTIVLSQQKVKRPSDTLGLLLGCLCEGTTQKFNRSKEKLADGSVWKSEFNQALLSSVVVCLYTTCHFPNTNSQRPLDADSAVGCA